MSLSHRQSKMEMRQLITEIREGFLIDALSVKGLGYSIDKNDITPPAGLDQSRIFLTVQGHTGEYPDYQGRA